MIRVDPLLVDAALLSDWQWSCGEGANDDSTSTGGSPGQSMARANSVAGNASGGTAGSPAGGSAGSNAGGAAPGGAGGTVSTAGTSGTGGDPTGGANAGGAGGTGGTV